MKRLTYGLLASSLVLLGCKTLKTKPISEKVPKKLEYYSFQDERSALPKLKEEPSIKKVAESLKAKNQKTPSADSLLNLARLELLQERYQSAEDYCRRALKLDLKNQEARKVLSEIYYKTGRYDLAAIMLENISHTVEKDSSVYNLMGLVAYKKNDLSEALRRFKMALELNASDVAVRMNLGVLYLEYRQLPEASVQFERVLKLNPKHQDAKVHLAIIKSHKGEYQIAETMYKEVLENDKENPLALYNLAVLAKETDRYTESLDLLKRYLATKTAKNSDNAQVFALIEDLQKRQDAKMEGNPDNDEAIQAMAAKLKKAQGELEDSDQNAKAALGSKGKSKPEPKKTPGSSDEISDLEKELK